MEFSKLSNPRQAALITCRDDSETPEKDNIMTVAWHSPVSSDPPMYAISIQKDGFSKDIIQKTRCFSVNFMSERFEKDVLFCGRVSGMHTDKFQECSFTKEDSNTIDCPRIKEASSFYECEIINEVETGDHIIFIGKVTHHEQKENTDRIFHLGGDVFKTI